ncbi:hypothetical protein ACFXKD_23880 [Nocardiopsis aegyptia]|uniref:hypothetical protein n=1 Tax=Nocardiopsis aegyptia TaxID=220378 RepID=UPI00366BB52A
MDHSSHAVLSYAIALLRALFTPARGRHSAAVRRRRSTRVRRYAPVPDSAFTQVSAPVAPRPVPRLAPPREDIPAEDVALVRGYYRAFENERETARVQAEALARLDRWTGRVPSGDLLAPAPPPRVPADDLDPAVAA